MEFGKIIISENAAKSDNPQDVINSNISVINLMREEKVNDDLIHEDALMSYYLDYYASQCAEGGFAQFVYNSGWNKELNEMIEEGLGLVGAQKHLEYFQQQFTKVKLMSSVKRDKFLKGRPDGVNPVRDLINNQLFSQIGEDLVVLNADFLKTHPDLEILPVEEIFAVLEEFVGHQIRRE